MMSHYGASKAAVINFTRALGMAWGRKGIRVNCIAPGPVETEGYLGVLTKQTGRGQEGLRQRWPAASGMGRWGKVEEIAYPCVFLASDASGFMTGATIVIDGGAVAPARRRLRRPCPSCPRSRRRARAAQKVAADAASPRSRCADDPIVFEGVAPARDSAAPSSAAG